MIELGRGELIHIESWIGKLLPRTFRWRGERHSVRHVESTSTNPLVRGAKHIDERLFALRTSRGLRCILRHDLRSDTWSMMRVLTRREHGG